MQSIGRSLSKSLALKKLEETVDRILSRFGRIPKSEIEDEANTLIRSCGDQALDVAAQNVQRAQWAKGSNDSLQRSSRVAKEVRRIVRGY